MIKIVCNNITLKVEAATLTLVTKNNAFSDSFSLEYSQHPFLIIEDKNTLEALGTRHVLSLLKQKEYEVTVFRNNKVYFGKLKVRSYVEGARKCDLVFGSDLLKILDKPISEFMPSVYLGNQMPYTETTINLLPQDSLSEALFLHEKKSYPEVDFQFPEIYAPEFYDKEDNDNEWQYFRNVLNLRNTEGQFLVNDIQSITSVNYSFNNYNTLSPAVYLLSIFTHMLKTIDFVFAGSFAVNKFAKQILLLSNRTNNSVYLFEKNKFELTIANDFNIEKRVYFYNDSIDGYVYKEKLSNFGLGNFKIDFKLIDIPRGFLGLGGFKFIIQIVNGIDIVSNKYLKEYYFEKADEFYFTLDDFVNLEVTVDTVDFDLEIIYVHNVVGNIPVTSNIQIYLKTTAKPYIMHPTIDLARHVPNWTAAEYLNNCKNLFNLKIDIDDSLKTIKLDFVDDYLNSTEMVDLSNYSLQVKNYENNQSDVFKLSYANDDFVRIDKQGISQESVIEKDAIEIDNAFLTLPFNGTHHELKKDDLEDGVVLVLNKPGTKNTVQEIDDKTLNLSGEKGIANTFWKDWVRFRQNASNITLVGEIGKLDRIKIERLKKVYYQNIVFLVEEITTKEKDGFTETVLKLQSKVF